jgi:antitoxin component YwqK of YwqJK toxin-antitoxin module
MIKNQSINGKREGYWESYYSNGNIWFKVNYKNGTFNGYLESYSSNGELHTKVYFYI